MCIGMRSIDTKEEKEENEENEDTLIQMSYVL